MSERDTAGDGWPEADGQGAPGDGPERVLRPLPPVRGRGFAASWWGRRWVRALEDTALEPARLVAGRRLARAGAVGAVLVRPGRITAVVRGRDGLEQRADVLLRRFQEAEWRRLLAAVAAEAGHIAALLDRDMPPRLVEDAAGAGVELLPGIGDLEPRCECGEWDHCEHTAALSYQLGRLLDQDPFLLLLIRGRGERELLAGLQELATAPAGAGAAPGGGGPATGTVTAAAAYGRAACPPPAPPEVPREAGRVPAFAVGEDPPGTDADGLAFLVAATALRAARLLAAALAPGHEDSEIGESADLWADAARLAASASPGDRAVTDRLAAGCGRRPAELEAAGLAWRFGGGTGLAVLESAFPGGPDPRAGWEDAPGLDGSGGRWTVAGRRVQLRYGPDGRWYPYRRAGSRWVPAAAPDRDPAAAFLAAED